MKNFMYTKKVYVHKIATIDLSKVYFLKNAKKTCKPKQPLFKSRLNKGKFDLRILASKIFAAH